LCCNLLDRSRDIYRLQDFEASNKAFQSDGSYRFHSRFNYCFDFYSFIINILIQKIMAQKQLLFVNKTYDKAKPAVGKNQIIQMNGYEDDRYVVCEIEQTEWGLSYQLINLRTHRFEYCHSICPLSEKFGIGFYYDNENPQFMDAFEVAILRSKAEQIETQEKDEQQKQDEHNRKLETIGAKRLEAIVPVDAKAVIVAELHEDESDSMIDYFGYSTQRKVILGFSKHTKDLFSEMRNCAANFSETAHLAENNKKYEHREKYSMGEGYYLGASKYHGWIIRKAQLRDTAHFINEYALIAGDEANICLSQVQEATNNTSKAVVGDFIIVDYSEKAIAIFGDTKPVKDQLKALGGRFNPKLTHDGEKKAGWIFSKGKEQCVKDLLTVK
jgi:hypothetical protein